MRSFINKYWGIFILAILLRLILAAISFHPDIQAFALGGWVIQKGFILSLYDYLRTCDPNSLAAMHYPANFFIYPPSIYLFQGFFYVIFSPLIPSGVRENFLFNIQSLFGNPGLWLHLLTLKLPYLIFDILGLYFFVNLFEEKNKTSGAIFWLFNPVLIYATYLQGQFDLIPMVFTVWSLFVLRFNKKIFGVQPENASAIILGLGAAFKIYPLFLLLPLASLKRDWFSRIKIMALGLLTYFLTIIPYIGSRGFRSSALVASLTSKSLYAQIPISGGEAIMLFLFSTLFVYIIFLKNTATREDVWQRFFIVLLLFFSFTHYHPQWFLWLTPFLIIDLIKSNYKNLILILMTLFSFTALLFFFDQSLTFGFFAPMIKNLYNGPSLWQILHINPDLNTSRSVLQTIFVAAAFYYIYRYLPKRLEE